MLLMPLLAAQAQVPAAQAQTAPWTVVASPNASPWNNQLAAVASLSANDVWAVGSAENAIGNDQPLSEHWDGTWSIVPTPTVVAGDLFGLAAISSTDVWAGGSLLLSSRGDTARFEHWNGRKWTVVKSPAIAGATIFGLAAVSSSDVWAVGSVVSRGGVVAGGEDEVGVVEQFLFGELVALIASGDQRAEQIVGWLGPLAFDEPGQVCGKLANGRVDLLSRVGRRGHDEPLPPLELAAVGVGDAEDLGDDGQRKRIAEQRYQVGWATMVSQVVKQPIDDLLDAWALLVDGSMGEGPRDQPADSGVLGRVEPDEHARHGGARTDGRGTGPGRRLPAEPRIAEHDLDIGVPQCQPCQLTVR